MTNQEAMQQQRNYDANLKAQTQKMTKETDLAKLKAEYWEAQVRVIKASLEYESLVPEYKEHQERMRIAEQEALERFQEQVTKNAQNGVQEDTPAVPAEN